MVGRTTALGWRLLSAIAIALTVSPLVAQNRGSFRTITSDDGLPQNSVQCMMQDSDGFMVLGTKQGVSIFDGTRFETYRHEPGNPASLPADQVWSLLELGDQLWIGTSRGLCRLDRVTRRVTRIGYAPEDPKRARGTPGKSVHALLADARGTLWIGTDRGVDWLPRGAPAIRRLASRHPLRDLRSTGFLEDGERILAGTSSGLFRIDPRTRRAERFATDSDPVHPSGPTWCLHRGRDSTLWVGTGHGLFHRDARTRSWRAYRHDPNDPTSLGSDVVWQLLEDSRGQLWIGTRGDGVDVLEPGATGFRHYRKRPGRFESLVSDRIHCLLEDHQHRIWIGTQNGLSIYRGYNPHLINLRRSNALLAGDSSWGMTQDVDGKIWIGTYGGLTVYDPQAGRSTHYRCAEDDADSLSNDSVLSIAIQRDGTKWIATKRGLNRFVAESGQFVRYVNHSSAPDPLSSDFIYTTFVDSQDRLWLGTRCGVDLRRDDGTFAHLGRAASKQFPAVGESIFVIARCDSEHVYLGTRHGLFTANAAGEFRRILPGERRLARAVWSLHQPTDGELWIGTAHGLGILRGEDLQWIGEAEGLPNSVINSITSDAGGDQWVATNWGLARLRTKTPGEPPQIRVFSRADGLQGNEYNLGSVLRDRQDRLYFGGNDGVSRFDPMQFGEPEQDPLVITKVGRGSVQVPVSVWAEGAIELTYGESDLEVQFAMLQFAAHDKCQYRYRLVGFENAWRQAGNRSYASYTRLPPGNYTFEVDGTNNHRVRSETRTLRVKVLPAFWQTDWFVALTVLTGLVLVFLVLQFRTRALRRANLVLETHVKSRTQELTSTVEELSHEVAEGKRLRERLGRAQRMEAFGVVAAGVAHDLNNVLSGLVTYPDLILAELPPDSPLREDIQVVRSAGRRAATIVQELQSLTRKTRIEPEVIDLDIIVQRFATSPELRKVAADHHGTDFRTETSDGAVEIEGSPDHIANALLNITKNAAEAQPSGGVILIRTERVALLRPREGYELIEPGTYAVLSVQDEGVGISTAERRKLFEPFYSKKSFGQDGTGVGLAVVWNTVHEHGGFVDVQSTPGEGTTISLYFPITATPSKSCDDRVHISAARGHGERILVVDDHREQRDLGVAILETLGYAAEAVDSGEAALRRITEADFDLLVLDMILEGGIDGLETYKRVLEARPGTRAVITSGYADDQRMEAVCSLGATERVDKPYSLVGLANAVRRTLESRSIPARADRY